MDLSTFIVDQALVIIPVLYILGKFLKASELSDKYIPLSLLAFGIMFSVALLGFNVQALIQGVLVAGTTVFTNELVKQYQREE